MIKLTYDQKIIQISMAFRKALGYTQMDVAEVMGIPNQQAYVSKIERGSLPLRISYIVAIAELVGCSPLDIDKQLITNGRFNPNPKKLKYLGHGVDLAAALEQRFKSLEEAA